MISSLMTLYVDNNAVPAAPCVDVYAGERLGMGSTAIGREASRVATYVTAERVPIASTPVPCRSPALQSVSAAAETSSTDAVVRGFLGHHDVVHMAFMQTGSTDSNELRVLLKLGDGGAAGVTHACAQPTDELVHHG